MKAARVAPTAYIAPGAVVLGDVVIEDEASVWFGCVVRAEDAPIVIGPQTNVQDLTVVHTDPSYPCRLGREVTVGHRAVIHGATVEDGALIGIGAVVLNGAVVGAGAIVGAGAVVTEGTTIPPRTLAVGIPARVVRPLQEADLARLRAGAAWYVRLAQEYRAQGARDGNDRQVASSE